VPIAEVLSRLRLVRPSGRGWIAQCPAHEDRAPSLAIHERGGKILLHCHAGCTVEAVCRAAGIELRDLFENNSPAKRIDTVYAYADERGDPLFEVVRYSPKGFRQRRSNGRGGWVWNLNGSRRVLYRLPEVLAASNVLVVEGEKDADIARTLGFVATCNPGGAGKWRDQDSECLRGKSVYIIADSDTPGRKHAQQVAVSLAGKAESLKVLELPGAKDLSEWIERGGTCSALLELIACAADWKQQPSVTAGAITRPFSTIRPQPLRWLWPGRIPLGKLTLLIGDPGLGKSLVTIDIAARISRGLDFPDGACGEVGEVILLSAEDDAADTIRPRLDAAGADVARIHTLEGMRVTLSDNSTAVRAFNLETGIATLEDALARLPGVRLIIIDPISAYLGGADSNTNAEVRGLLSPLAALAAKYGVAVLCVTHLRKSAGAAVHRAIASIAFAAAARAVWAVASDPSSQERRLMLAVKQNLGPNVGGLAFRVETQGGLPRLDWEPGAVNLDANDVLSAVEDRERNGARQEVEAWLSELLAQGAIPVQTIKAEAKEAGISWMTVRRAKESLHVLAEKSSYRAGWEWRLEDGQGEDAHDPNRELSTFDQTPEETGNNSKGEPEDVQKTNMSIFDRGQF
jgi:putative DNA primase/helicase